MGNTDFLLKWGAVPPPPLGVGLEGACPCCPKSCVGEVGYGERKNKKPSAIKPNQQSAKKRLTLKDGALSTPGSATGTISSPIDLSNVKLSLGSNPFAVMSTETSIIGSSSYGSGRGGGGSCKRSGSGEDGWEVSQFWIACSRSCSHSSYRSIARSDSLLKSKMSTIRKRRRKDYLRFTLRSIIILTLFKHFLINLHKQLERIIHHAMDRPIPMGFRVLIQCGENDGEDDTDMFAHEVDNVLIVPVVQCAFRHLKPKTKHHSVSFQPFW